MKKITTGFLAIVTASVILLSCSSAKKNVITAERADVKGNWVLNTISYDGLPAGAKVKMDLLGEGEEQCLKGSTWSFPNNGKGKYTITSSANGCRAGERSIVWSLLNEGTQTTFQYKILAGGVSAKDTKDGYKFKVISSDKTSLVLQSTVNFEGSNLYINYTFSKQ